MIGKEHEGHKDEELSSKRGRDFAGEVDAAYRELGHLYDAVLANPCLDHGQWPHLIKCEQYNGRGHCAPGAYGTE